MSESGLEPMVFDVSIWIGTIGLWCQFLIWNHWSLLSVSALEPLVFDVSILYWTILAFGVSNLYKTVAYIKPALVSVSYINSLKCGRFGVGILYTTISFWCQCFAWNHWVLVVMLICISQVCHLLWSPCDTSNYRIDRVYNHVVMMHLSGSNSMSLLF